MEFIYLIGALFTDGLWKWIGFVHLKKLCIKFINWLVSSLFEEKKSECRNKITTLGKKLLGVRFCLHLQLLEDAC